MAPSFEAALTTAHRGDVDSAFFPNAGAVDVAPSGRADREAPNRRPWVQRYRIGVTPQRLTPIGGRCSFTLTSMSEFDAAKFLRKLDSGELDAKLCEVLDNLTDEEVEELALLLNSQLRARAANAT